MNVSKKSNSMADALVFIREGWQAVTKQESIWAVAAVPSLITWLIYVLPLIGIVEVECLLFLLVIAGLIVTSLYSFVGVPYLAYRFCLGQPVSFREALKVSPKFMGRLLVLGLITFLAVLPLLVLYLILHAIDSRLAFSDFNIALIFAAPQWLVVVLTDFCVFYFFSEDATIGQSLSKAWRLFVKHFSVVIVMAVCLALLSSAFSIAARGMALWAEPFIDVHVFSQYGSSGLAHSVETSLVYRFLSSAGGIFFQVLGITIAASAFIKLNGEKENW